MRHSFTILLTIYLFGIAYSPQLYAQQLQDNIIDLTQIKTILGEPDKVIATSSDSETWEYGSSKIFIRQGKVVAWSDNTELGKLAETKKLRSTMSVIQPKETQNWINPWTPPLSKNEEEIINEIVP